MSLEEKAAMHIVDNLVKLYLEESTNDYILEDVYYGTLLPNYNKVRLPITYEYNGFILIREKYSPIRFKISIKQIYKWYIWRETDLLESRERYLEENKFIVSTNMKNYYNRYSNSDISKVIFKKIIKKCKGFN